MAPDPRASPLDSQRLFVPGILVIALACLGISGYCYHRWSEDRQEAAEAQAERTAAERLDRERAARSKAALDRARQAIRGGIDRDFWPSPEDLDVAARDLEQAETLLKTAEATAGIRHLIEGFRAFGSRDRVAAERHFQQAAAGPEEAVGRYAMGRSLLDRRLLLDASKQFVGAVRADGDMQPAAFFSALADLDMEMEKRALPQLEKAARRWPDSPETLEALGRCLVSLPMGGDRGGAIDLMGQAIGRGLRDDRVLSQWVTLATAEHRAGQVETELETLLQAEPNAGSLHLARGRLLRAQGEVVPAVTAYARAMQLDVTVDRQARIEMALLYLEAGQSADCLKVIGPAAEADPKDPELRAYVAYAERQQGKDDQARELFIQSCDEGFYPACEEACSLRDLESCLRVNPAKAQTILAEILHDVNSIVRDEYMRQYEQRRSAMEGGYSSIASSGRSSALSRDSSRVISTGSASSAGSYYRPTYSPRSGVREAR